MSLTHGIVYDHESHLVDFAWQVTLVLFVQMISHHIFSSVKEIFKKKWWTLKIASNFWYKYIRHSFVSISLQNVTLWFKCPQTASRDCYKWKITCNHQILFILSLESILISTGSLNIVFFCSKVFPIFFGATLVQNLKFVIWFPIPVFILNQIIQHIRMS